MEKKKICFANCQVEVAVSGSKYVLFLSLDIVTCTSSDLWRPYSSAYECSRPPRRVMTFWPLLSLHHRLAHTHSWEAKGKSCFVYVMKAQS